MWLRRLWRSLTWWDLVQWLAMFPVMLAVERCDVGWLRAAGVAGVFVLYVWPHWPGEGW